MVAWQWADNDSPVCGRRFVGAIFLDDWFAIDGPLRSIAAQSPVNVSLRQSRITGPDHPFDIRT